MTLVKKPFVLHPFLFAIFPILFLFSHNIEHLIPLSEVLLLLIIVLGIALFLILFFRLTLKDSEKAGIIASIFLVLFFSYGHVYNITHSEQINIPLIGRHRYLAPLWCMLFACGIYFTVRTRRNLYYFTNILNIAAFSLVLIPFVTVGVYKFRTRAFSQNYKMQKEDREIDVIDPVSRAQLRDIYYIILDSYVASSVLKETYGYDNSKFTDFLAEKGFYTAPKSLSNYSSTFPSLASSLNMKYINYLSDIPGIELKWVEVFNRMIEDGKVINFLKSKGYKFIYFSAGFTPLKHNRYADLELRYGKRSEFLEVAAKTTMLSPFVDYFLAYEIRQKALYAFSRFAEIYKIKGPKFIFAHIFLPHPPYIFNANGETLLKTRIMLSGKNEWEYKEGYVNQLIFTNKKVKVLINEILSQPGPSPIIILQGDHGIIRHTLKPNMRILNAYHLPAGGNALLYDSISPVNTFRLIFNFYFGANYELLNDESYFSAAKRGHDYKFINVTDAAGYD